MKVLFLVPYPFGKAPSQRFRFEQYLEMIKDEGIEYKYMSFLNNRAWSNLYLKGKIIGKITGIIAGFIKRWLALFSINKYDFIFIHRESTPIGPPVFEWLIAKVFRKRIIYDFDDAIWLADPNESFLLRTIKWKSKVGKICKWSYKVSCGNKYLADYARKFNNNVIVNPTTIDTTYLHNPELHDEINTNKLTIGWTGTHSTLPYLNNIVRTIEHLEGKFNFDFMVIANRNPEFNLKSLKFVQWSEQTEIADLLQIDIGIMPLTDDPWSSGKCGFKALQYMSLNIPVLASAVGVNNSIIENGVNGFLCNTEDDWINRLSELINSIQLRKKIGENGRIKVINSYSILSNKNNFLSLFS